VACQVCAVDCWVQPPLLGFLQTGNTCDSRAGDPLASSVQSVMCGLMLCFHYHLMLTQFTIFPVCLPLVPLVQTPDNLLPRVMLQAR